MAKSFPKLPQWQCRIMQQTLAMSNADLLVAVLEESWPAGGEPARELWSFTHKKEALVNRLKKTGFLPEHFDPKNF